MKSKVRISLDGPQRSTHNVQLITFNSQRSTHNVQLTTFNSQRSTHNVQLTTFNSQRSGDSDIFGDAGRRLVLELGFRAEGCRFAGQDAILPNLEGDFFAVFEGLLSIIFFA